MDQKNEDNACPICLDEIGEKNNCITECGHKFCLKCLSTALREKNTCPMCRKKLLTKNTDIEKINRLEYVTRALASECNYKSNEIKKYEGIYLSSMMKIQEGNTLQEQLKKDVVHRSLIIKLKNTDLDEWRKRWKLISRLAEIGLDYKPTFLLAK